MLLCIATVANQKLQIIFSFYLASVGDNTISSRINRMLRVVITDVLASQYNFLGSKQQKFAFSKLQLCKCIIKCSEKQVEDAIKIWLNHASQRMKSRRQTA
ncbi:hypothetical protein PUN28_009773 [Cardiocondyla obscurior]|uniref:Uncharacterized protein n=1 Tax=Cardiocondyla obscurior TaxID=286306 RepID=A0AAW2FKA8_9HYME